MSVVKTKREVDAGGGGGLHDVSNVTHIGRMVTHNARQTALLGQWERAGPVCGFGFA